MVCKDLKYALPDDAKEYLVIRGGTAVPYVSQKEELYKMRNKVIKDIDDLILKKERDTKIVLGHLGELVTMIRKDDKS